MVLATKQDYLFKIEFDYLLEYASETKLYRNYRKYFTKKDFVNALLRTLTKEQCINLYNSFIAEIGPKEIAHDFLYKNPTCDIIRDRLVSYLEKDKKESEVIFFEFPVLDTRTDVTRVNGRSYNYEIKTNRDKIDRLQNQMNVFTRFFERNLVVCPHTYYDTIIDLIPYNVGVIVYDIIDEDIVFKTKRPDRKSRNLNSEDQLMVMTVERLRVIHRKRIGRGDLLTRQQLIKKILSRFTNREINDEFKLYLKNKYSSPQNCLLTDYT